MRTITFPSTSSRRMRFGEPTSSLPSGVIVAALSPRPASRIALAASVTTSLEVARRCSSERSKRCELELDPEERRVEQPQRLLEQLLSGLVALEDDDLDRLGHAGRTIADSADPSSCEPRAGPTGRDRAGAVRIRTYGFVRALIRTHHWRLPSPSVSPCSGKRDAQSEQTRCRWRGRWGIRAGSTNRQRSHLPAGVAQHETANAHGNRIARRCGTGTRPPGSRPLCNCDPTRAGGHRRRRHRGTRSAERSGTEDCARSTPAGKRATHRDRSDPRHIHGLRRSSRAAGRQPPRAAAIWRSSALKDRCGR